MAKAFPPRTFVQRLLPAVMGLALLASACAPRAAPGATDGSGTKLVAGGPGIMSLKFSHIVARNTPKGKAADRFAELVREKSRGRIDVQVFPDSELFRDGDEFDALLDGRIQFIASTTGKYGSLAPQWEATALPYLLNSEAAIDKLLDQENPVAKELFESMRPKGMLGLGIWANGWKNFIDNKKPLRTPADFQGVTIGNSGKPDEAFVNALGGKGQAMPLADMFGAITQGAIDGHYGPWSNLLTQKFYEVTKYATISRGGVFHVYGVATNAKWWDGLDADSRNVLADAVREATVYARQVSDKLNADALLEIRKSGRIEFAEQTDDEAALWRKAAERVVAQWEPKTGREIIDKLRAMN